MNIRFLLLSLLFALLFGSACETDFQLEGEWEDIPVIYGIIAAENPVHYIRVERAFLEPGGNAVNIAQIPDSIFYDETVSVQLEKLGSGEIFDMERINGEDEGIFREEGDFANTPNILYKLRNDEANLRDGDEFRIIVERKGQDPATATSAVIDSVFMNNNDVPNSFDFGDFEEPSTIRVRFRSAGDLARVFSVKLRVNYRESLTGSASDFVNKSVDWEIASNILRGTSSSETAEIRNRAAFYSFLAANLEPLDGDAIRKFVDIQVIVDAAGSEIEEYLRIAGANIGITSSQDVPVFTNVVNGRGIVSSNDNFVSESIPLTGQSLDSLWNSTITRDLKFVP